MVHTQTGSRVDLACSWQSARPLLWKEKLLNIFDNVDHFKMTGPVSIIKHELEKDR